MLIRLTRWMRAMGCQQGADGRESLPGVTVIDGAGTWSVPRR